MQCDSVGGAEAPASGLDASDQSGDGANGDGPGEVEAGSAVEYATNGTSAAYIVSDVAEKLTEEFHVSEEEIHELAAEVEDVERVGLSVQAAVDQLTHDLDEGAKQENASIVDDEAVDERAAAGSGGGSSTAPQPSTTPSVPSFEELQNSAAREMREEGSGKDGGVPSSETVKGRSSRGRVKRGGHGGTQGRRSRHHDADHATDAFESDDAVAPHGDVG
eukprot:CAMPEP_0196769736 /NCGR_PEP_ID=MMETSP1104-20130614/722_1 /TAXON_ID=33652 /ORGANISM="Cafeteria sp., Strain Caron Lab Isolate" /LENGTH=218 /DNA_ID=CAMNT_0042139839 /DNA_START=75 /DNA_END=728 /DNA_ORIENTATION=+